MKAATEIARSNPASHATSGGPVSGTIKIPANVANSVNSGSNPTKRANAAPELAAAPVATIITAARSTSSIGINRTTQAVMIGASNI